MDNVDLRKIIAAVLLQIIKDLRSNNESIKKDAVDFLNTTECRILFEYLDVDYDVLLEKLRRVYE